jgi:HD-like signal output (HDOD) protein
VSINLDQILTQANLIEPLPATATRLAGLLSQPDWDLQDVVRAIELDAALTARLLRVANSVLFRAAREISTARDAVLRVGAATAAGVAVGIGARHLMLAALPEYQGREDALWRHSVASALAVQHMGRQCKIQAPPEAFTAALLHDIGKILLCQSLNNNLIMLLRDSRERGMSELEAEWEVLEVTHPELGGLIAQHWNLPASIVQAISLHHSPLSAVRREHLATCRAVQLADCVAKAIGAGIDGKIADLESTQPVREALGLGLEPFQSLCRVVGEELESTLALYES